MPEGRTFKDFLSMGVSYLDGKIFENPMLNPDLSAYKVDVGSFRMEEGNWFFDGICVTCGYPIPGISVDRCLDDPVIEKESMLSTF